MKVAIPLFKNRVSPHFSTAPEAILVQIDSGEVFATWKINLSQLSPSERRIKLLGLGIEALFCGGIDGASRCWFEKQGIRVEDNRMGEAAEILERYLKSGRTSKYPGG